MHDAVGVRRREAVGDLHREVEQPLQRQWASRQLIAQRLAFEPFRHQVVRGAVDVGVVDPDDVGMIQRAGGAAFGDEAALPIGIARGLGMQQLDGDVALEPWIPSGMMALSVMWMCSGQTLVQHLVMLQ